MISEATAMRLNNSGISSELSLEDLLNQIEQLGYNNITFSHSAKKFYCKLTYKDNAFINKKIFGRSRRESAALALVWGLTKAVD
ncbi:MAG TPA: hypothetical protein VN426_05400 [Syntrophomonadaceae bacterium]|nr:hypothetical protein [Syntrophomonadaceae bacterium]